MDNLKTGLKRLIKIFTSIDWANIAASTYVRVILQAIAVVNIILILFDITPIHYDEATIYNWVSYIVALLITTINMYKNNSTSSEAITSDKLMHTLKDLDEEQAQELKKSIEILLGEYKVEEKNEE